MVKLSWEFWDDSGDKAGSRGDHGFLLANEILVPRPWQGLAGWGIGEKMYVVAGDS